MYATPTLAATLLLISAHAYADDCDLTDAAGGTASTALAEDMDRCLADPDCAAGRVHRAARRNARHDRRAVACPDGLGTDQNPNPASTTLETIKAADVTTHRRR